jgi:gamma-glutamyltranspeptidase/glutathione hydrolase
VSIVADAVIGVVTPMMNGVGGDLFAIVHDGSTGQLHGVNAGGFDQRKDGAAIPEPVGL